MRDKSSAKLMPLPAPMNAGKRRWCLIFVKSFHDCDGKKNNDTVSRDTYREAPMNKSDADEAQFVHSPWLTPVEPDGIKPVIFRAMVLYLTPRYFFNLRALFTKLSLGTWHK